MSSEETFFSKLKKLAGSLDRRVEHLQQDAETKQTDFCEPHAIKILLDLKKELRDLTRTAESQVAQVKTQSSFVSELVKHSESFLENQQAGVEATKDFLRQYGYVDREAKCESKQESKEEDTADEKAEEFLPSTPEQSSSDKPCSTVSKAGTPKLEDAGFSDYTLAYLKRLDNPAASRQTSTHPVSGAADLVAMMTTTRHCQAPDIPDFFKHNGILVTPSLLGSKAAFKQERHEELASPVLPVFQTPGLTEMLSQQKHPAECVSSHKLHSRLKFEEMKGPDSPEPYTCKTSGRQEDRLCQGDGPGGSPVPPVFHSQGVRQIEKAGNQTFSISHGPGSSALTCPEQPEPCKPQFSSEVTSDITGVYAFSSLQEAPKAPESLAKRLGTETTTPPVPELLSTRLNRIASENADNSGHGLPKKYKYGDMPEMPKLQGKYAFISNIENQPPNM